ncbi:MAG: hybrid sensor histidine kinase/response regulator [Hyphomonadaceae bacterium]|nr:hybrid sensor histidine kinase/response regulator [Hyphomonadaceae bacterium]
MPIRIEALIADEAPLRPDMRAGTLLERFLSEPDCVGLPVVFERTLVGLVQRSTLFDLAVRIGRPALDDMALTRILDSAPEIVASGTPLGLAARNIAEQGGKGFRQGVVVTHGGAYYGFVPAATLARELASENTRRAHKLQLAARKIEAMRGAEARATKAGHEALARLGHEVRTPLTALLGHAERLLRAGLPVHLRQNAEVLVRASESLADLVTRSVEAGQAGAGALRIEEAPISLRSLMQDLDAMWRAPAEARGLEFETVLPPRLAVDRVLADGQRLRQILCNLLSNAVKYTQRGGVSLSMSITEREEGQFALGFSVSDTGPGIAAEEVGRLFQPFERLSSMGAESGTGLGLNIARGLAEAMGGRLSYAPGEIGGSQFDLRLVVKAAGPRLATRSPLESPRARHAAFQLGAVLLIEDHPASQAVIQSTLKAAGWRVDTVDTLAQANRRAGHMPYQAILCDYHLRDGTGDLFLARLRDLPGPNRDTLCLAVTADASEARRAHCLATGFTGVLTKPIRGPELITRLADYIAAAAEAPLESRATA